MFMRRRRFGTKRFILALVVLAHAFAPGCSPAQQPAPPKQDGAQAPPARPRPGDVHLALGNPSAAKHDPDNPDPANFLMVKDQYALSYNSKRGTPNWVSYRLRREDMGRAERSISFYPDDDLPRGFYQVKPFDYHFGRTGMSRGHMCPSSHRNNTEANSKATFIMTNMVPQTEELNAGSWNDLEIWCRDQCFDRNKELYIVCGPHGIGGTSARGTFKHTDFEQRIVVPKHCWKVILVLDAGSNRRPEQRVTERTRLIAVLMPNTREPDREVPWQKYVVSTENIEQLTGLSFFDKVPAEIIGPLKKRVGQ
jgi:endonuclease G